MKLYDELAWIWSVITPADAYQEEAENLWEILCSALGKEPSNILEFGCGGGYLIHHMPNHISACLVDISEQMLAESKRLNAQKRHILGDMLTIDCKESFDCVLVHDAVMYLQSEEQLILLLENCKRHLNPGGKIILVPDAIKETFYERHFVASAEGKHQGDDISLLLTEWHWDPDPEDNLIQVEFSLLIRRNGEVKSVHESHDMLAFALEQWMKVFQKLQLKQEFPNPPWFGGGEFFLLSSTLTEY